jgi:hypothetical protein
MTPIFLRKKSSCRLQMCFSSYLIVISFFLLWSLELFRGKPVSHFAGWAATCLTAQPLEEIM